MGTWGLAGSYSLFLCISDGAFHRLRATSEERALWMGSETGGGIYLLLRLISGGYDSWCCHFPLPP